MVKFSKPQLINGVLCDGYDCYIDKNSELKEKRLIKVNIKFYPVVESISLTIPCKLEKKTI